MKPSHSMELNFPTNEAGHFISQEELLNQEDAQKIKELSLVTGAMPHLITKTEQGEWLISGLTVNQYLQVHEGNDNTNLWKRD